MNILIILAHPGKDNFTHKIGQKFSEGVRKNNHNVEIFDLYDTDLHQGFLQMEDIEGSLTPEKQLIRDTIQSKIEKADEIVFVHPLWWGGVPAILKNFIDNNFFSGFAYKNKHRWWPTWLFPWPERLLKGKSARVYITCDIPLWMFWVTGLFVFSQWYFPVLLYCGLGLKSFHLFTSMRWRKDKIKEKWLTKVLREAKSTR
jgi:NAD(P)H dehydrogenase (quinone)